MRILLLLAVSSVGWGQGQGIGAYLGLTDLQLDRIAARNDSYVAWESEQWERGYTLQVELEAETAKSPLDPMALGVRYAELEMNRREVVERGRLLVSENMAELTEAQRGKLRELREALERAVIWADARELRLVAYRCVGCWNVVLRDPSPREADLAGRFLELTAEQILVLEQRVRAQIVWQNGRALRLLALDGEIRAETAKSPLEPLALGVRYAELEMIRREVGDRDAELVATNVEELTEAQRGKLGELERAMGMVDLGNEARRLRLLGE